MLKPAARLPAIRIRWRIFSLLFGFGFLAYLQQKSITVTAAPMMPELGLSHFQISMIEWAFVLGYGLFQLPGGIFGQRLGARLARGQAIGIGGADLRIVFQGVLINADQILGGRALRQCAREQHARQPSQKSVVLPTARTPPVTRFARPPRDRHSRVHYIPFKFNALSSSPGAEQG